MPNMKNYEVKIRSENYDLVKVRISGKMVNVNFPKVSKITKINCTELSTVTKNFLDFHFFRKRKREKELIPYKEVRSFLIVHVLTVAP